MVQKSCFVEECMSNCGRRIWTRRSLFLDELIRAYEKEFGEIERGRLSSKVERWIEKGIIQDAIRRREKEAILKPQRLT